jgi:hypothetical protein
LTEWAGLLAVDLSVTCTETDAITRFELLEFHVRLA